MVVESMEKEREKGCKNISFVFPFLFPYNSELDVIRRRDIRSRSSSFGLLGGGSSFGGSVGERVRGYLCCCWCLCFRRRR